MRNRILVVLWAIGLTVVAAVVLSAQSSQDPALNFKATSDMFAAIWSNLSTLATQISADHTLLGIVNTNAAATQTQLNSVAANQLTDEANINTTMNTVSQHSTQLTTQAGQIATLQAQITAIPAFPKQLAYYTTLAQTAAVPSTTLITAPATAAYLISLVADCTGTGTIATNVSLPAPSNGVSVNLTCPAINTGSSQVTQTNYTAVVASGSVLSFKATITGTPTYDARVSIVQLGAN